MDDKQYKITEPYPGWLDEAVDTKEASRITGIPEASLITMRSRSSGPIFLKPKGTRLVRYIRKSLYNFLFSGGLLRNTSDTSELYSPENDNEEDA